MSEPAQGHPVNGFFFFQSGVQMCLALPTKRDHLFPGFGRITLAVASVSPVAPLWVLDAASSPQTGSKAARKADAVEG